MMRRHLHRPIFTLAGRNRGDILDQSGWWKRGEGVTLDEFYRSGAGTASARTAREGLSLCWSD